MICFVLPFLKKKNNNHIKQEKYTQSQGRSRQQLSGMWGEICVRSIKKCSLCHQRKSSFTSKYPAEMPLGKGRGIQKNPGCGTATGAASKPVPAAHGVELDTLKKCFLKKFFLKVVLFISPPLNQRRVSKTLLVP